MSSRRLWCLRRPSCPLKCECWSTYLVPVGSRRPDAPPPTGWDVDGGRYPSSSVSGVGQLSGVLALGGMSPRQRVGYPGAGGLVASALDFGMDSNGFEPRGIVHLTNLGIEGSIICIAVGVFVFYYY